MLDFLPKTRYDINKKTYEITNICISVLLKRLNIDKTYLYQDVLIQVNDTPESISERLYKTPKYWWVVLVVNSIVDPYAGLVMDSDVLVKFARKKYGDENKIQHFFNSETNKICDDLFSIKLQQDYDNGVELPSYIMPISHLIYEQELNLDKMKIKAINPQFVASFEEIFKGLIETDDK